MTGADHGDAQHAVVPLGRDYSEADAPASFHVEKLPEIVETTWTAVETPARGVEALEKFSTVIASVSALERWGAETFEEYVEEAAVDVEEIFADAETFSVKAENICYAVENCKKASSGCASSRVDCRAEAENCWNVSTCTAMPEGAALRRGGDDEQAVVD